MALLGTTIRHQQLSDPPLGDAYFNPETNKRTGILERWTRVLAPTWQRWFSDAVRILTTQQVEIELAFPATAASNYSDLEVEFKGAQINQPVKIGFLGSQLPAGAVVVGYVETADIVTVRYCNFGSSSSTPGPMDIVITVDF